MSDSLSTVLDGLSRPNWAPYTSALLFDFDHGLWYEVTNSTALLFLPTVDFSEKPNSQEIGFVLKFDGSNIERANKNSSIAGQISRLSIHKINVDNLLDFAEVEFLPPPIATVKFKEGIEYANFKTALLQDLSENGKLESTKALSDFLVSSSDLQASVGTPNPQNEAPTANLSRTIFSSSDQGRQLPVASLLKVQDKNYDVPTKYEFRILNSKPESGYFIFRGEEYRDRDLKSVAAKDLNHVFFVPGKAGSTTDVSFRANDGQTWSKWASPQKWRTAQNNAPIVRNDPKIFQDTQAGKPIKASTLFSVFDKDNDTISRYAFKIEDASKSSGYFIYRKQRFQDKELTGISAKNIKDVAYVPGNPGSSDRVSIKASDGKEESPWTTSTWKTSKSPTPIVTINKYKPPSTLTKGIGISNLIQISNPSLTPIAQYSLKNTSSTQGGYFVFKGKIFRGQELIVKPEDLNKITYIPGAPGNKDKVEVSTLTSSGNVLTNSQANWTVPRVSLPSERRFNMSIDRTFQLGDYLGIPNSKEFRLFIGPDINFTNQSFNPNVKILGGEVGIRASTGDIELKAGLDLNAGYDLGSLSLRGGAQASVGYEPTQGLSFSGAAVSPQIDITIPNAFLKLDAVAKAKFNPRLSGYYSNIPIAGSNTQSISLPSLNINKKTNLIDINTQSLTGSSLTRTFNFGGFESSLKLPNFSIPGELNSLPRAFRDESKWRSGFGDWNAYGYSGSSTLLDFNLSLAPIATYLGLPISFNQSILGGAASIEAKLIDLGLSAKSTFSYAANVAIKPNAYIEVEGSTRRYELKNGLTIKPSDFSDLNNDNKIKVTLKVDPIIGINAFAGIESNVDGFFKALEASAKVDTTFLKQKISAGPLLNETFSLGSLGTETLFDKTSVFALSEIFPRLQSSLVKSFDIPI